MTSLYQPARPGIRRAVLGLALKSLLTAVAMILIGMLVDRLVGGEPVSRLVVGVGAALTAVAVVNWLLPIWAAEVAAITEHHLRTEIFSLGSRLGSASQVGSVAAQATEAVTAVGTLAGTFLPQLIGGIVIPLLICAVVAVVDPLSGLVLLLVVPLVPLLLRAMEKRFRDVSDRYRSTADRIGIRFLDGVQGMGTLKGLDASHRYGADIAEEAETLRVETMGLLRVNQLAIFAVDSLFTLGTVVAAATVALWRMGSGAITLGEAVAIALLGLALIEPLSQIGRFFYLGAIGRAGARQVRQLLDLGPIEPSTSTGRPGAVSVERVDFGYGETAIFDKFSMTVEPGEKLALVGPSGVGKTTLARLILGLRRPQSGEIRVGGRKVMLTQRPFLFYGSVADNLRLARPDASDEEIWAALEAAGVAEQVAGWSGGLDTQVGDRGLRLSGGQAQRLAIARALLADADLVVLDEPTSNVDLETEAAIKAGLERLTADKTVITIAHRKSTLEASDRIVDLGGAS